MEQAYILVETQVGKAEDVAFRARPLDQVVDVDVVTGPYDVIVRAEAASIAEVRSGALASIEADLRVTRSLLCPIGAVGREWQPEPIEPEPLPIPEPEPLLTGPHGPPGS